ncbi:MAG: PleD family two-component system response regulator [Kiloniellales bacterium]
MKLLSEEEIDSQAEREVVEDTRDIIAGFDLTLQQVRGGGDAAAALAKLRQDAFSLRTKVQTVSINGLAPLIQRLDEYVENTPELNQAAVADVQTYIDRIAALLDGEEVVKVGEVARVVREMPHQPVFNVSDVKVTEVEAMVVMPQRSAARAVQRELAACGYRTSVVTNPLEALGLIIETQPDFVISAMIMPRISGADLCCALAAMPATKHIPVAVLTSLELDHPDLAQLPMNVGRIRRGPQFGDDLADVLQRFKIT